MIGIKLKRENQRPDFCSNYHLDIFFSIILWYLHIGKVLEKKLAFHKLWTCCTKMPFLLLLKANSDNLIVTNETKECQSSSKNHISYEKSQSKPVYLNIINVNLIDHLNKCYAILEKFTMRLYRKIFLKCLFSVLTNEHWHCIILKIKTFLNIYTLIVLHPVEIMYNYFGREHTLILFFAKSLGCVLVMKYLVSLST